MIFRFHFDGQRVKPEDTPDGLGMQSGDCIDVMSCSDMTSIQSPLCIGRTALEGVEHGENLLEI